MADSAFANNAAAVAAGYVRVQDDLGAGYPGGRYRTYYEKWIVGEPGTSGQLVRQEGRSDTQANGDTQALNALNAWRNHRYGTDTATTNKGSHGGGTTITRDVH